jgi:hypothetical protein
LTTTSDDEVKQLVPILMKTMGWSISFQFSCADDGTIKAILRLNSAGTPVSDRTDLPSQSCQTYWSAVNDESNCVFAPARKSELATEGPPRRRHEGDQFYTLDEASSIF